IASTCARCAPLSKIPGSRLLMVTLREAVWRARPATKPTKPERAPFDRPSSAWGIFTLRETMLMMRPKPRDIRPSTVSRIISIGDSIMASSAAIQLSRDHSRKSPGSGPSALLSRISGSGQATSAAERPCAVVMSPVTVVTLTPVAATISAPVFSSASRLRATMVTSTPSCARAKAQARPRPRLAPLSSAFLPRIPSSISRGDGGDRADLVAVSLVEPELLHDADALGQRLAAEIAQGLAQIAGRQSERLHQRFHRHRIDGGIGEVQERQQVQVGGFEILRLGVAFPRSRDRCEFGRRHVASHVGGAVAAE